MPGPSDGAPPGLAHAAPAEATLLGPRTPSSEPSSRDYGPGERPTPASASASRAGPRPSQLSRGLEQPPVRAECRGRLLLPPAPLQDQ